MAGTRNFESHFENSVRKRASPAADGTGTKDC